MRSRQATARVIGASLLCGLVCGVVACGPPEGFPDVPTWRLSTVPVTTIGRTEGDSTHLFQRIAGVELLADGRVVVADGGLSVVRVFDADGRFLTQMGRRGDGPGEFGELSSLFLVLPDTVVTWDHALRRLTFFTPEGELAQSLVLDVSPSSAGVGSLDFVVGALSDGAIAMGASGFASRSPLGADRISLERFARDGSHLGRAAETTGLVRAELGERVFGPVPFSPYPYRATFRSMIYHTNGASPAVFVWSGGAQRTLRLPAERHDLDRAWAALVEGVDEGGSAFYVDLLPSAPHPDSLPHVSGLMVDDRGRAWTKRYDPSTDALWLGHGAHAPGGTWWVTEPNGDIIASVRVPGGFAPYGVVADRVVGVRTDALGVERVEVHTVRR